MIINNHNITKIFKKTIDLIVNIMFKIMILIYKKNLVNLSN